MLTGLVSEIPDRQKCRSEAQASRLSDLGDSVTGMPGRHQVKGFRTTPKGGINEEKLLRMVKEEFNIVQRHEIRLRGVIGQARRHHVTWQALGDAMGGQSRQSVQQKFGS